MAKVQHSQQKPANQSVGASENPTATPKEYHEEGFGNYHDK